jgi:hypothetical protein
MIVIPNHTKRQILSASPVTVRRTRPPSSTTRDGTMKIKKRILAIPAAAAAIPTKPNRAAIKAMMKKCQCST